MSQEKIKTDQESRPIGEVERIRDIIFGPQMRLYEKQFKRVSSQLDLLSKQLEEFRTAVEQQWTEQEARMRQLQEDQRQRASRLGQLEANLEQLHAELTTQTHQLAAELQKQRQELQSEFMTALDALEDGKTSRDDLGDLLVEMGTRLKGQMGLADLLGQLGEIADDSLVE